MKKAENTTTAPELKGEVIHPKNPLLAHPAAAIFPLMEGEDMKEFIARMKERGFDPNHPVVIKDGMVIDGRNRLYAATELGIKYSCRQYDPATDGESPVQFSVRENMDRRHLTGTQRALAAKKLLPLLQAEAELRQKDSQFKKGEKPKDKGKKGKDDAGASGELVLAPGQSEAPGVGGTPPADGAAPAAGPAKGGKSADIAAKMFGTSPTMVKLANKLEKKAPDLYEQVVKGTMTITAAEAAFKQREEDAKAEAKAAKEKEQRAEALALIAENYAKDPDFVEAIKKKKLLKIHSELVEFAAMVPGDTKALVPLLVSGWGLEEARNALSGSPTMESTMADVVNFAIAQGDKKGTYTFELEGYKVTVKPVSAE